MNTRNWNKLLVETAILALAVGVTYACKDFLNTTPQVALPEDALATASGVEGSLIAAYRSLDCSSSSVGSWGCAASNWVWGSVTSGDAHKGSNLGDQEPVNEIETYLWSAGDVQDYLNQKWSQVYEGVSRANATLRLMGKVRAAKPAEIDSAEAAGIRGEALFLRAHYHFEAYRMWGNIPYYNTPDDTVDFKKTNQGVDVIGNIVRDLYTAAALLNTTPRNGDVGRATSWTAKAYKGRVYAYAAAKNAAYWDSALTTLRNVQAAGPYRLETSFDHVWTGFTALQNGPETILAFQASIRDGEPNGWNSNWGERLNFPHSGSHFGCCGFHQPSYNLVNFFAVDAAGLPLAVTNPNWNTTSALTAAQGDTNFAAGAAGSFAPVDPRLDWTVGRDRVPYKDWGLHDRGWIRDASYSGPFSPKKNVHEQGANAENNVGWQATQTNDVNIHIFRYADLLLLLAEAVIHATTGVLDNARTIVNQIRARAGKVAQGCGTITDTILTKAWPTCKTDLTIQPMAIPLVVVSPTLDTLATPWAVYKIGLYTTPFTTVAQADQAVQYERRLELAMEGQRFFDLRRWRTADAEINGYIAVERNRIPYLQSVTYAARDSLYPIPSIQLDLAPLLIQNKGW